MQEIRTGIIGVGNCASSLVQGRFYYDDRDADIPGLITKEFGGYRACDIQFVAAFDVDERKVSRDLSEAIFAEPNCTAVFQKAIPFLDCPVEMGYVIDSIPVHNDQFPESARFKPRANIILQQVRGKARYCPKSSGKARRRGSQLSSRRKRGEYPFLCRLLS